MTAKNRLYGIIYSTCLKYLKPVDIYPKPDDVTGWKAHIVLLDNGDPGIGFVKGSFLILICKSPDGIAWDVRHIPSDALVMGDIPKLETAMKVACIFGRAMPSIDTDFKSNGDLIEFGKQFTDEHQAFTDEILSKTGLSRADYLKGL